MRAAVAELFGMVEENPARARLCVVEALAGGVRTTASRETLLRTSATALETRYRLDTGVEMPEQLAGQVATAAVAGLVHSRLVAPGVEGWNALVGRAMYAIVLPYLGPGAAREELERPPPPARDPAGARPSVVHGSAGFRMTYRTLRVLQAVAEHPGRSNREVAARAGAVDPGQISKLLGRLERAGIVQNGAPRSAENGGGQRGRPTPNEWLLTQSGEALLGIHREPRR